MPNDAPNHDFEILLFWLGLAGTAGFELVRENTRLRRLLFGALATVFAVIGFAWPWLKGLFPPFTAAITSIATNPETWFILAVIIYAIFIFGVPKARADRAALEDRLGKMREELAAEIARKADFAAASKTELLPVINRLQRELESFVEGHGKGIELLKLELPPLEERINQIGADIVRHNDLGVSLHAADNDLRAKLERQTSIQANLRNLESKFRLFVNAVRAHDAMNEILIPSDQTAMSLEKN